MITICPACGETVLITPDHCLHCGKKFTRAEKGISLARQVFFRQRKDGAARSRLTPTWIIGFCFMSAVLIVIASSVIGVTYGKSPETAGARPVSEDTIPVIGTQTPRDRVPDDPVTGTWIRPLYDRTVFYTFAADGAYSVSDSLGMSSERGIWTKAGENRYNVTVGGRKSILFMYQPETGTVAMSDTPDIRFSRQGNATAGAGYGPAPTTPAPGQQTIAPRTTACKEAAGFRMCWDNPV